MKNNKVCKSCSISVRHSFDEVKSKIDDFIKTIDPDERVSEEVYAQRLSQCSGCNGLYYKSTCRFCGCFVQMRALRKKMDCPNPSGSIWNPL